MSYVLLLGAGFSRNWGGWLASEAFEYLLGCLEIDQPLRQLLWKNKAGGFEATLAFLQNEHNRQKNEVTRARLQTFQAAVAGMFNEMDNAFARANFEFTDVLDRSVAGFLHRFDAIFTLNQDLLLERHYMNENIALSPTRKWDGVETPGMRLLSPPNFADRIPMKEPDPAQFRTSPRLQPYFKLHGSMKWTGGNTAGGRLIIMGGNKAVEINQYPVLNWYHQEFKRHLAGARLMVIGYSFNDEHINVAIGEAADRGHLRLFVIDPLGVDVIDKTNQHIPIRFNDPFYERLQPSIVGASRRPLRATFGDDHVEFAKLMRFFA